MTSKKNSEIYTKIILHAWKDPIFKKNLESHTNEALKEEGFEFDPKDNYTIIEDKGHVKHLVFPEKPEGEISEDFLEAGGGFSCFPG